MGCIIRIECGQVGAEPINGLASRLFSGCRGILLEAQVAHQDGADVNRPDQRERRQHERNQREQSEQERGALLMVFCCGGGVHHAGPQEFQRTLRNGMIVS